MFWNVRAMPRRTTPWGGVRSRVVPSSSTSPASGVYSRVITLKTVVFPAPFGPIRPETIPRVDVERHAVERHDAAEAEGHVPDREEQHLGA